MLKVRRQVPLAPLTTLQIGGVADYFVAVENGEELSEAVRYAKEKNLPITILGGGSNVLIKDSGLPGLTIHNLISGRREETVGKDVLVTAGAGEDFDTLVAWSVTQGYWGLENLSHIPGLVGATPIQNVGAYGTEIKDLVTEVEVYNPDTNATQKFTNQECDFSYRHSFFKTPAGKRFIVVAVTYRLSTVGSPKLSYPDLERRFRDTTELSLEEIRAAIIDIRSQKFPDWKKVGTAGSFFKNPIITATDYSQLKERYPDLPGFPSGEGMVKVPLGYIIDKICHYKGVSRGQLETYRNQALVLVNRGGATALEVSEFASEIATLVKTKTDIDIEWEVTALPGVSK